MFAPLLQDRQLNYFSREIQKNLIKSVRAIVQMEFLMVKQLN